ncbi:MAG: dephospho-CoA kinase [Bacillota bacterium]
MKIIGITGGTGSGKGYVSNHLKTLGAYHLDADAVGHEIIKKGQLAYDEIVDYFGKEILGDDGEIMRKSLGRIVFSDAEKLKVLNQCTHKYIQKYIEEEIEKVGNSSVDCPAFLIDAPLLLEGGLVDVCDAIFVVFAPEYLRVQRIIERDSITEELAKQRITSQKSWSEYEALATHVIKNEGDEALLKDTLNVIWKDCMEK